MEGEPHEKAVELLKAAQGLIPTMLPVLTIFYAKYCKRVFFHRLLPCFQENGKIADVNCLQCKDWNGTVSRSGHLEIAYGL